MKTPTEFELRQLIHQYDPVKAHEYYLRIHKPPSLVVPRTRHQEGVKAQQKKELAHSIHGLEQRFRKLEALIAEREHEEARENRKSKAKKERAAKDKVKPKTAAEKAKAARELRNRRTLKHEQDSKQRLKTSVDELKTLATKVRGQLAVANQKLAAL